MRKILILVNIFISLNFYSQFISVSGGSPQQLANKIVNTNCVTTSNWSVNSGSVAPGNPSSSVGSFTNSNPAFPFASGVVLSTGNSADIKGPKVTTTGSGNVSWTGDADMNTALSQSNFLNASSLQFNFVSTSSSFNFNYVFASDEYGNNQCTSGDGIVILLTNLSTGVTVNLAKVPVVNQNVSVATIRNNAFNTTCSSVNPSFFANYYAGPPAANAPINFLGQTVLMTASATIVANQQYKLKIVIADSNDGQNDSALFMNYAPVIEEAPNLLGPDISSTNNSALCNGNAGNPYTLTTGLSPAFTYTWKKDGIVIPGAVTSSYTIPASETFGVHTYEVLYLTGICSTFDGKKDLVLIEFLPIPVSPNPITLYKCTGDTSYNLANITNIVTKDLTYTPVVSYYLTNIDAQLGLSSNALPQIYTGTATTLFVRLVNLGSSCPLIRQFSLSSITTPLTALSPVIEPFCSITPTVAKASTNLSFLDLDILGPTQLPSIYKVSYHTTFIGANTNTDLVITNLAGYTLISASTVFTRVSLKSNPSCFVTSSINILVNLIQISDKPLANIVYCGNPGYYTLPPLTNGQYFLKKYDENIPNSQGDPIPAGTLIPSALIPSLTPNATETFKIYISNLITTSNKCSQEWELKVTLIRPSIFKEINKIVCDEYKLPDLAYGNYINTATNAIIPDGTVLTTTTQISYLFQSEATSSNPSCNVTAGPITITIENKPDLGPLRENIFVCNIPYILPSLAAYPGAKYYPRAHTDPLGPGTEITNLDLTSNLLASGFVEVYAYKAGSGTLACPNDDGFKIVLGIQPITPIVSCNYTLPVPNVGNYFTGPGGTGNLLVEANGDYVIEQTQTLYLYTPLPAGGCDPTFKNEVLFTVIVSQPTLDNIPDFTVVDGVKQVVSCGNFTLPIIANGKYFTDSHYGLDPTGGTQLQAGVAQVSASQPVYIYDEIIDNTTTPATICSFEKKFNIVIYPKVLLDDVNILPALCGVEFYQLPDLEYGEYYTSPLGTGQLLDTALLRKIPSSTTPVTIYAYNTDPINNCPSKQAIIVLDFKVVELSPIEGEVNYPIANVDNFVVERCATFTLPTTLANGAPIKGSFFNGTGGFQGTAILPNPANGVQIPYGTLLTIPTSTTLNFYEKNVYIYNSYLVGVREFCPTEKVTRVILYKEPKITTVLQDMYFCLPTPIAGADLPVLSGPNISATLPAKYYTASHLGGGTGGTEIITTGPSPTVLTNGQTIYAYVKNESIVANSTFAGCFDEKSFKVNIFKVEAVSDVTKCGSVLVASLPTLAAGNNYYINPNGVGLLTDADLVNNTSISKEVIVYVYGLSGFPAGKCQSAQTSFKITITPRPSIFPVPLVERTFCDKFDNQNDGLYNINLSQFDTTIKGSLQTVGFAVTYHATEADANNNIAIISTNATKVFAVVRTASSTTCFSDIYTLDLIINKLPEPLIDDKLICVDSITKLPISGTSVTFDTQLSANDYTFVWQNKDGVMLTELGSTFTTGVVGTYFVTATNKITGCTSLLVPATVITSSIAITGYTVTQNFEDNQTVVVIASGANDDFIYSLDGAPFVSSNVFENLEDGNHIIIVRDVNGCGDSPPINVLIINYPKYFTPNGDSFNDAWNIKGLSKNQIGAKISIFDRQGKLMKQISPNSTGWDGTYNGSPLPSDDYWFVVRYLEDGIEKEFKSHFAMKR